MHSLVPISISVFLCVHFLNGTELSLYADEPRDLFRHYCFDCHQGPNAEGNLDLSTLPDQKGVNLTLVFENLAMGKMPPTDSAGPAEGERIAMMSWLADHQGDVSQDSFRRISRHEFVHSVNDLLAIELDLVGEIPDDRGTRRYDSDRRIQLSREMLASYFAAADEMLNYALPADGFVNEQVWITNKLKDSHETYNIYLRDYKEGVLFSWTRANNGNSYSFFYDNFEPPVEGWYELTFDLAKVGELEGDISVQVHAGKYYYADDRPQPQRLLDVISVGNRDLESKTIRAFLRPGENVSVHCFHKNNFRDKNPLQGAYIRHMKVRGPLQDQWPPSRYATLFGGLRIQSQGDTDHQAGTTDHRVVLPSASSDASYRSNLKRVGGRISVSSFQQGMEKEKMQDGSNRTFWHTQFKPSLAPPPHFVILENPSRYEIEGLMYATWSGGNGNGQVQKFEIYASDDRDHWGQPIVSGDLETRLANEQPITFPEPITRRFIKFLITKSFSIDGRSLASIGKLDVVVSRDEVSPRTRISIDSDRAEDMRRVLRRFAERAFASELTDDELEPYFDVATDSLQRHGEFVQAAKVGFKAIICSHRFLMAPGEHSSKDHAQKATLARVLWRSIPEAALEDSKLSLRKQIERMLADRRSDRMIQSLCGQWLNLRSWNKVSPSLKLYPEYDDLLDFYLPLETTAYLSHLIRANRPVSELIDSDYSFLNQRLADHYGIQGVVGQRLRKVAFDPEVPRGGLLTMGSVLKVTTDGFDTSPILRGAWISKNIVGTPISPPPESVKAIEPEHGDGSASLREQIELHKNNDACYACHKSIDPYGFALENFDSTGQWRDQYRIEVPHRGTFQFRLKGYFQQANQVDASGEINDKKFSDIEGLKGVLLTHDRKIAYNFAKKFFEYANGYEPNLKQRSALFSMIDSGDCRMGELLTDVLVYSLKGGTQ